MHLNIGSFDNLPIKIIYFYIIYGILALRNEYNKV